MFSALKLLQKPLTAKINHLSFCIYLLNPFNLGNNSNITACEMNCYSPSDSQGKVHKVQKSSTAMIISCHSY